MEIKKTTAALTAALERATPGDWQLQDGCSWRRIGTDRHDGNVLCPVITRHDGHPDLEAGDGRLYGNLELVWYGIDYSSRPDIPVKATAPDEGGISGKRATWVIVDDVAAPPSTGSK